MAKTTKKKRSNLSPAEKKARKIIQNHTRLVRTTLRNLGFARFPKLSEIDVSINKNILSDIDDVFVHENIILLLEYTTANGSDKIATHLRKKKNFFRQSKMISLLF